MCPEKRIGIDSAVSAIASVTEVEMSTDLAIAKVYLSIFSDEQGKTIAISGLKRLEGYVRKHIATSMNLRMAPEVRFLQDDTIARAEHVSQLDQHLCVPASGQYLQPQQVCQSTSDRVICLFKLRCQLSYTAIWLHILSCNLSVYVLTLLHCLLDRQESLQDL